MQITAIILSYNNYADLKNCLASLGTQALPAGASLEIIVIDNHSTDGSIERIREEFPGYQYIMNPDNLGFARGVNQGLKAAFLGSDYFLLANNDAILEKEAVKKLLEAGADLAGPTIFYGGQKEKIWQAGGYWRKSKMGVSVPLKNKVLPADPKPQAVDFLSGCVLLIKKSTLEKIGFLDEDFFFYGEDLDLCWRAKQAGLSVIYEPRARAWHNIEEITRSRTSPFVLENLARSYWLISRKHFPNLNLYSFFLFYFLYTPFRLWQITRGAQSIGNIRAWLSGGRSGRRIKI